MDFPGTVSEVETWIKSVGRYKIVAKDGDETKITFATDDDSFTFYIIGPNKDLPTWVRINASAGRTPSPHNTQQERNMCDKQG